jgi:hypothetical protein
MLWSIMYILYTYAITCAHGVALNNSKVRIRDGDPYCPFFFRFCVQSRWNLIHSFFSVNIETNNSSLGQLWDTPMHVLIADSACLALQDARWNFQLSRRESRRQSSLRRSQFWAQTPKWFGPEIGELVGGLEHFLFFHILGIIIPTDELIFFRGV